MLAQSQGLRQVHEGPGLRSGDESEKEVGKGRYRHAKDCHQNEQHCILPGPHHLKGIRLGRATLVGVALHVELSSLSPVSARAGIRRPVHYARLLHLLPVYTIRLAKRGQVHRGRSHSAWKWAHLLSVDSATILT